MSVAGPKDLSLEIRSEIAALRLLIEGWNDGLVDAAPGTVDGAKLHAHVLALSELIDGIAPIGGAPGRRRSPLVGHDKRLPNASVPA